MFFRVGKEENLRHIFFIIFIILSFVTTLHSSFVVRDEFTKVYDIIYGETIHSSVNLYNPSEETVQVRISQADYAHTKNGDDFFLEPRKYTRSNANWINFPEFISIRAKENVTYHFTITAPNQRDFVGTYWSVLFFDEVTKLTPLETQEIALDYRYCIQIISNLKNTGIIDISVVEANYQDGNITLTLKNIGSLWFDATIKIDIFNQNAELVDAKISERHRIYPDLEKVYKIPIEALKSADYYAIIMVDGGNNRVFGHQISFQAK